MIDMNQVPGYSGDTVKTGVDSWQLPATPEQDWYNQPAMIQNRGPRNPRIPTPGTPPGTPPWTPPPGFNVQPDINIEYDETVTPPVDPVPWQRPDWFTGSTNPWGFGSYGETPNQDWYRDPSWGAHAIYNQDYGFQNLRDVGDYYTKQGWDVDPTEFAQAGFTPQMDSDWSKYGFKPKSFYDDGGDDGGGDGGLPPNWGDDAGDWGDWFDKNRGGGNLGGDMVLNDVPWNPQGQPAQGAYQGAQGYQGAPGFQYPSQLGTASDVMTRFAQGLPTQTPWQWQEGSDMASQMTQTGMPTSYEPMYQRAKGIAERDTTKAIKQAAEQAGLQGLRWSTPLGQTAQRIAGENMANLGLGFAGQEMGALEAARGRQMGGMGALQGFGQGTSGLTEAAKNRGMQAAGGLTGLGQQYLDAPQDWAAQMYQMGGGMQQQSQAALDRYKQDFMRMSPEFNPWVNQGMSYWGTPSQMGYQQYNPSPFSQILGGAGSLGAMGLGLGGLCE